MGSRKIVEGQALVQKAIASRRFGVYTIQAAIAAIHGEAATAAATDWSQMVALYDVLAQAEPSPVVALNRAVAIGMRDGPLAGLNQIDAVLSDGHLNDYRLAHAARADFCRRWGARRRPARRIAKRSRSANKARSAAFSKSV